MLSFTYFPGLLQEAKDPSYRRFARVTHAFGVKWQSRSEATSQYYCSTFISFLVLYERQYAMACLYFKIFTGKLSYCLISPH